MSQFGTFTASELYCPQCQRSQPVREELLLIQPSGELYEYRCARCDTALGQRSVCSPQATASQPVLPDPANQRLLK